MLSRSIKLLFSSLALSLILTSPSFSNDESLDELFESLKNASSQQQARGLENSIWKSWLESDDAKVNELMQQALRKREVYDFNGALEILNQVIALKPDFSEAWNQRATVYFHQDKYEESLQDIARTLALEPRHFGSLAGRAMIRIRQGKQALAIQNIIEAIKFHPYLKERSFFPMLGEP